MAFENFSHTVWEAEIQMESERMCVWAEDCNKRWEGKVEKQGESVTMRGVAAPTITVITKGERKSKLPDREELEDSSVIMYINYMATFNYEVDDLDAAQADGDIKSHLSKGTSAGIASAMDQRIAQVAAGNDVPKLFKAPRKLVSGTAGAGEINILTLLDLAAQHLYENDVPTTGVKLVAVLSPAALRLFTEAYGHQDTDNHELMKNGRVAMYHGIVIKMSNNVAKSADKTQEHIAVRTSEAIAFANPRVFTKPYSPEKGYGDALKGYSLYDAMVVRPKEIVDAIVEVPAFEDDVA